MRAVVLCAAILAAASAYATGAAAQALPPALSAREAFEAARTGRALLVDIRTPAEWADTGVPEGATRLDSEAAGFEVRLAGLRLDNPGRRIALIDRSGGLAISIQMKLAGRGWRDLALVRGGMLGQGGWLAEKLPVTPYP
jgi:rhodanese-related sulfurtransferase